jgi:hypothetical protein
MDVPGLVRLILDTGAAGLKQLALAGVDPHTIGAILALGDLTPVCNEYRKKLSVCRTEQRKSNKWIYNVIEVGSATNFLVDELLKTRAGENILALLSTIIPVLCENSYTDTLLMIFSTCNIGSDLTPGIGQMQRLRASLLPFTNALDIKNIILQYHMLFCRHNSNSQEPRNAIPDAEVMARVIQAFRTVTASQDPYRLIYKGIRGAAWAAAYALHILGLGVCMVTLLPEGQIPIPMSAGFDAAQVVFYVGLDEESIELYKSGVLESFIQPSSLPPPVVEWTVDCDMVNYFSTLHPTLRSNGLKRKISEFVAAKTLDCVVELSQVLSYSVNVTQMAAELPEGLSRYQNYTLPSIQMRSLTILDILGFCPPRYSTFQFNKTGQTIGKSFSFAPQSGPEQPNYWEAAAGHSGDMWWSESLHDGFYRFLKYWTAKLRTEAEKTHDEDEQNAEPNALSILKSIKNAVLFAAYMAFTDWDISLRRMSVNLFGFAIIRNGGTGGNINANNNMRLIQEFCSAHPNPEPLFWSLGQELNGVVLLRRVPMIHDLNELKGILISFRPGHIIFNGERCIEIIASTSLTTTNGPDYTATTTARSPKLRFHPHNRYTNLHTTSLCRLTGGNVYVSLESLYEDTDSSSRISGQILQRLTSLNPELIAEVLTSLLVTSPCSHDYYTPLSPARRRQYVWYEGLKLSIPRPAGGGGARPGSHESATSTGRIVEGPEPAPEEEGEEEEPIVVYYQAVDGDGLGQWLACHLDLRKEALFIMQREACLDCTLSLAHAFNRMNPNLAKMLFCIIAGGVPSKSEEEVA